MLGNHSVDERHPSKAVLQVDRRAIGCGFDPSAMPRFGGRNVDVERQKSNLVGRFNYEYDTAELEGLACRQGGLKAAIFTS
jgi:hypothetical protein